VKIGRHDVPEPSFDDEVIAAAHRAGEGQPTGSIARFGPPRADVSPGIDADRVRLFAALKDLERGPETRIAATVLSWAPADVLKEAARSRRSSLEEPGEGLLAGQEKLLADLAASAGKGLPYPAVIEFCETGPANYEDPESS